VKLAYFVLVLTANGHQRIWDRSALGPGIQFRVSKLVP
jgi:hypothetical protein